MITGDLPEMKNIMFGAGKGYTPAGKVAIRAKPSDLMKSYREKPPQMDGHWKDTISFNYQMTKRKS